MSCEKDALSKTHKETDLHSLKNFKSGIQVQKYYTHYCITVKQLKIIVEQLRTKKGGWNSTSMARIGKQRNKLEVC